MSTTRAPEVRYRAFPPPPIPLNDCWPCLSWSLIDYEGVEKAAYHAVRRAFAPVLASFRQKANGGLKLWITNDGPAVMATTEEVPFEDLDGHIEGR